MYNQPPTYNPPTHNDPPTMGPVPNYLALAIITTVLCCLPFGIVAIVYAAQVDGKLAAGDYAGAVYSSNKAKNWSIASAASAAALLVLYLLFFACGTMAYYAN